MTTTTTCPAWCTDDHDEEERHRRQLDQEAGTPCAPTATRSATAPSPGGRPRAQRRGGRGAAHVDDGTERAGLRVLVQVHGADVVAGGAVPAQLSSEAVRICARQAGSQYRSRVAIEAAVGLWLPGRWPSARAPYGAPVLLAADQSLGTAVLPPVLAACVSGAALLVAAVVARRGVSSTIAQQRRASDMALAQRWEADRQAA